MATQLKMERTKKKVVHSLHIHIEGYGTCSCGKWSFYEGITGKRPDARKIRREFEKHKLEETK